MTEKAKDEVNKAKRWCVFFLSKAHFKVSPFQSELSQNMAMKRASHTFRKIQKNTHTIMMFQTNLLQIKFIFTSIPVRLMIKTIGNNNKSRVLCSERERERKKELIDKKSSRHKQKHRIHMNVINTYECDNFKRATKMNTIY